MKAPTTTVNDVRKRFEEAGFTVTGGAGGAGPLEVEKYGCVHHVARNPQGVWALSSPPRFLIRGLACELEDQGYQKFWLSNTERFPIRLDDLKALQRFDQEVRYLLGLKSLYHEGLGTTCARSAYDRLEGRREP